MVKHFLLFYESAPDYLERRPEFRGEHLIHAWDAADRGELLAGGAYADRVEGVVFLLTADELAATDRYEGSDYGRAELTLESRRRALVYVEPEEGQ